jgi:hypothetical protein
MGVVYRAEDTRLGRAVLGEDVTPWDRHTRVTKSKLVTGPQAPMLDRQAILRPSRSSGGWRFSEKVPQPKWPEQLVLLEIAGRAANEEEN